MAKKIKIDFSKTEERSGWNTRQIPAGIHLATITSVTQTEAQDGTAMLVYAFVPTDQRYRSRCFPYYCKLQQNQLWKLRDLLIAAGSSVPKKAVSINPESIIGKVIAIEVEDDSYNGTIRSSVTGTYDSSILEDYKSDLEEDDFEDELEEDEVEEEEDDFEDELEEDDFDDEDLDDFDEDDEEEEEPEPAPRKRVIRKRPAPKRK